MNLDLPEYVERAQINLEPGNFDAVVDETIEALIPAGVLYCQDRQLVHIVETAPATARQQAAKKTGTAIAPASIPFVRELASRVATFRTCRKRRDGEEEWVPTTCPRPIAEAILARDQWPFPALTGVISTATLRPDGSLLTEPGYDPQTGLYLLLPDNRYAELIDAGAGKTAAMAALSELLEIFDEFPFADEYGRSVALAMVLTALVRQALPGAPLFGISATVMGTGKTYLGQVPALLVMGQPTAVIAPPRDAKEEGKAIYAFMLGGMLILLIDNMPRTVESELYAVLTTGETYVDRVLSASKSITISTAVTLIFTGNNLTFAGDLTARALVINLDARTDHPEHRQFARNLVEWIPAQRERLVSAALTFLSAWLFTGEKHSAEPWQRFPEWDHMIRGALLWAGLPDPLLALRAGEKTDPRRVEHEAVMGQWHAAFGKEATPVRRAVQDAKQRAMGAADDHGFLDALLDVAGERGEVNVKRLGKWMARMAGRIQGGMRIVQGQASRGSQTWAIEIVGPRSDMWV